MGRDARTRMRRLTLALLTVTSFGALAAGCTTSSPETTGSIATTAAPRGATVAFESIDGLPQGQFRTLVQDIDREAETRNLAFVSRTTPSQYRIRGYASAQIRGRQTTIAWLWDVYDNTYQRVLRISGEEQSHARGWAGADDRMMAKIAQAGMDQLTPLLLGSVPSAASGVAPAAPSPALPPAAPEPDSTPMAANPSPMQQAALASAQ